MLTCVQIPSREIGRLSNKMISNVKLKVEISNVKADLKNTLFFFLMFVVSFRLIQNTCKTSAVTFRARCIVSQKLLLLPSLHKLLILWLVLDI